MTAGCINVVEENYRSCNECRASRLETLRKRNDSGICFYCENSKVKNSKYCAEHELYYNNYLLTLKYKIYSAYGAKCACCGEDEIAFLCVDHVNDDGYVDRSNGIRGNRLYVKIIKENFPEKYQILCHNCNHAKSFNPGGCPHKIFTSYDFDKLKIICYEQHKH